MKRTVFAIMLFCIGFPIAVAAAPPISTERARNLTTWKPQITAYSKRHYGEATWQLQPTCIVLHFTAGKTFPWNLSKSASFNGEKPGLASHYVIDDRHIWQILPPDVRSRGAYGINHRAINIEMIAANADDLAHHAKTLQNCADLVRQLMERFHIGIEKIYSHSQVGGMNLPETKDLVNRAPYVKPDPGEANMRAIKALISGAADDRTPAAK